MIAPMRVQDVLARHTTAFPQPVADIGNVCDTATVAWLAARLLRRYAQEHAGAIQPVHEVRLKQALQIVNQEMHWMRLCGRTAAVHDLTNAVSRAVFHARSAAALLDGVE